MINCLFFSFYFQAESNDTAILIDHSLQHHNRLHNANQELDNLLGSGSSALQSLKDQRVSLKVI